MAMAQHPAKLLMVLAREGSVEVCWHSPGTSWARLEPCTEDPGTGPVQRGNTEDGDGC